MRSESGPAIAGPLDDRVAPLAMVAGHAERIQLRWLVEA
jgi:hypothetical protein